MSRYVLMNGKFGMYFSDTKDNKDLTLKEVERLLNKSNTVYLYKQIIGNIRQCVPVGCPIDEKMNADLDKANAL